MAVLWFLLMQAFGLIISYSLFREKRHLIVIWLGSVLGSLMAIWLPVPFAFAVGFTVTAQLCALFCGAIIAAVIYLLSRKREIKPDVSPEHSDRPFYFLLPVFFIFCLLLLLSHTLSGSSGLYTGQCTYGDMSMHLGFISSIAEQGMFPPYYSILPSAKLCYPFLCDTISSSLYVLGLSLRWAYMLPMLFAFLQVFCGLWAIACEVCSRKGAPVIAFLLFFLNGGMGTLYFFGKYSFTDLFTGFYKTPTNLTEENLRWVNVIADMLLPQRATLFGWSILFGCLYMLFRAVFRNDSRMWLPAGIIGGLLPMIHTHSYLALGLTALCWLVYSAFRDGLNRKWFKGWLLFGVPAVLIAVPQLLEWTLQSVGGNESFLRFHLDWVNSGSENFFIFWFKNIGLELFIIPLAFIFCGREYRAICSGAVFIFVLCELVVFQPNIYDNNKLMYISYLFFCLMSADFVMMMLSKMRSPAVSGAVLAVFLVISLNAGVLTLAREYVSGLKDYRYELFSADEVKAVEYIKDSTDPDSLFLTSNQHNNAVAVLSGRNIVCGSSSYLYYHGLDYTGAEALEQAMLTDSSVFEANKDSLGIDYVYMSPHEKYLAGSIYSYLCENYEIVFSSSTVDIFAVK